MYRYEKIVILMTMYREALPFINNLNLKKVAKPWDRNIPMEIYEGGIRKSKIFLVLNGQDKKYNVDNVATQPATLTAYLAITKFNPDLIINAGTAGSFKSKGANIGEIYIGSGSIKFHDRRIPINGFREYGIGNYKTPDISSMALKLGLKQGIISTGNSLDISKQDFEMIKANNAVVKDMEAAAIAWVAELYNIPLIVIKAITDLIDTDKPTQDEFLKNLEIASNSLQKKLNEVVQYYSVKD